MTLPLGRILSPSLSAQIARPPLPINDFRSELQKFASKDISQEDYLHNCSGIAARTLESPEYSFYKTGIKKAGSVLDLFRETTSDASFVTRTETNSINAQFHTLFRDILSEKLATDAGQAFYPIPQLEPRNKIDSAQNWTALFFEYLHTLSELHNCQPLDDLFVQKLRKMTVNQLRDYAHSVHLLSFAKMIKQMEANPASFQTTLKRVLQKAQKEPESLSTLEQEYVNFAQMYNNYAMGQFPGIVEKVRLMDQCISLGHVLQKNKVPILESWDSFAQTLKE